MSESDDSGNDSDCVCLGSSSATGASSAASSSSSVAAAVAAAAAAAAAAVPPPPQASLSLSAETFQSVCILCAAEHAAAQFVCANTNRVIPAHGHILADCPWLKSFHANAVLARIIWQGVAELERRRDYGRAMELLQLLLRSEWSSQRRGRMWIRLLVDAKHAAGGMLKCKAVGQMLRWCQESLDDAFVVGGDRISLEKKFAVLTKQHTSLVSLADVTPPSAASAPASSAAPIIVSDDSDDDFEPPMKKKRRRHTKKPLTKR